MERLNLFLLLYSVLTTVLCAWLANRSIKARVKLFRVKHALRALDDPDKCVEHLKELTKVDEDQNPKVILTLTKKQYQEACEDKEAWCIKCVMGADGVEPDAREVECEECFKPAVYGMEALHKMGKVHIVKEKR